MPFRCERCGSRKLAYLLLRRSSAARPIPHYEVTPCCDGCERPLDAESSDGYPHPMMSHPSAETSDRR